MKVPDTYQDPIILDLPNSKVRVFRPVLSKEEEKRRMNIIHNAAADLLKSIATR
jgi:hypothetical protein